MGAGKSGPDQEQTPAFTGAEKEVPVPEAAPPKSPPDPATDTAGSEPSEDGASPEDMTPEHEAQQESEQHITELLKAYQETLDKVEDLPAVVWVPWGRKRPGSYFKVPYLRWFLTYFVTFHINKSLDALSRRLHATAALSDDSGINSKHSYRRTSPDPPRRPHRFPVTEHRHGSARGTRLPPLLLPDTAFRRWGLASARSGVGTKQVALFTKRSTGSESHSK